MTAFPQQQHPPMQPPPAAPQSGSKVLGAVSLVLAVLSVVAFVWPSGPLPSYVLYGVSAVLAIAAIVFGIVAVTRRLGRGLGLSGIIVGSLAALLSIAAIVLGFVATHQLNLMAEREQAALEERLQAEQDAEAAILDQSQWLADELAAVDPADFVEVDAETLAEVMRDPESHSDQGIIAYATVPEHIMNSGYTSQGLCITSVTLKVEEGEAWEFDRAIIIDRGTETECPFTTNTILANDGRPLEERLMVEHRVWLIPAGTASDARGDELPAFVLYRHER